MDLEEQGVALDDPDYYYGSQNVDFGSLKVTPLAFLLKLQQFPSQHRPFGFNFDVGFGVFFSDFDKGPVIKALELDYATNLSIDTDHSAFFQIGAGTDFYLVPQVSLAFRVKFLVGNIGTSWDIPDGDNVLLSTIDQFNVSNMQYMANLRFWF